jgi:hypothetical protein
MPRPLGTYAAQKLERFQLEPSQNKEYSIVIACVAGPKSVLFVN